MENTNIANRIHNIDVTSMFFIHIIMIGAFLNQF